MNENPTYPYHTGPMYQSQGMTRNTEQDSRQAGEAILDGIKRKASRVELYRRIVEAAPDQVHKQNLLHALEEEKMQVEQWTNFYASLTGSQPEYDVESIPFTTYEEGLQRAYQTQVEGYELYRNYSLQTPYVQLRNIFINACHREAAHAHRILSLSSSEDRVIDLKDNGRKPYVVNIDKATKQNDTFRTALWTGKHLQVTLMSIKPGEDIGLEIHPDVDQFLRIEQGQGLVQMGKRKNQLDFEAKAFDNYAIMVPAGTWHNVTNTGNTPLKLYSIYAPPEHPFGTVHETKADAMAAEE